MPTFPAPHPATVVVEVPFAQVHAVASDRDDVVVTVLPTDPSKSGSVRAAEEVRVERQGDAITLTYPGSWKQFVLPFAAGTADVTIELPTGSTVRGKTGSLYAEGTLDTVDMTLSAGNARLDDVSRLDLKVSAGSVSAATVLDALNVKVGSGSVRVDQVAGTGVLRASNGTTAVGVLTGSLEVHGAHGDIEVRRVRGSLTAKGAHGNVRVGTLESGDVTLATSYGSIEVGVPEGTAAYLDVTSEHGSVRNQLTPTEGPVDDESTAEIHARTGFGDIVVRRP
ncbi:DUF4097 family beta strand repeat-containing protein [Isoptericola halotolerans]|uniref:DUF4097 and DUF4098 domain-containing protein YvlB n=1 Tax=Isoptericola halotolerans TaxID=300560 RepID=A0ABX2A1I9_9MICO|nr:DUF4097 family beta strand repeat-containing protein [Isoptericola halotolerans]NOV95461.1 DUF4097 and DUF4098 domain-containing protein YvlB [Isoptericola halotolerans]